MFKNFNDIRSFVFKIKYYTCRFETHMTYSNWVNCLNVIKVTIQIIFKFNTADIMGWMLLEVGLSNTNSSLYDENYTKHTIH